MPEHNAITDPNIHEPKGVAAAAAGRVYKANGSGSGAWEEVLPSQTGQAGKVLSTNGTVPSWINLGGLILARASVDVSLLTVSNAVNVSSVSGISTVTVNFTTALPNTNYLVFAQITQPNPFPYKVIYPVTKNTGSIVFTSHYSHNGSAIAVGAFDFLVIG